MYEFTRDFDHDAAPTTDRPYAPEFNLENTSKHEHIMNIWKRTDFDVASAHVHTIKHASLIPAAGSENQKKKTAHTAPCKISIKIFVEPGSVKKKEAYESDE